MRTDCLTTYTSPHPKIRLGRGGDGGYVILDLPGIKYSCLVGAGIAGDCSFETAFLDRYGDMPAVGVDGTLEGKFPAEPRVTFVPVNVGNQPGETMLLEYLQDEENAFLKMDIEWAEWNWLQAIPPPVLARVAQVVLELHAPFHFGLVRKLAETHKLVHVHANNYIGAAPFLDVGGVQIPQVFETTWVRKDLAGECRLNTDPIPGPCDMPNNPNAPDILITWPPFVHES